MCTSADHDLNICKVLKDLHKTVVGVADTRYLLLEGVEGRKAEYSVPSLFSKKAWNNKTCFILNSTMHEISTAHKNLIAEK